MDPLEEIDLSKNPVLTRDEKGNVTGVRWWDGNSEVYNTIPPYNTREMTELERIYDAFERKFVSGKFSSWRWMEYLGGLGLEKSSYDLLLESLYSGKFDKVAVKDPMRDTPGLIIVMDREFAKKVLVMGDLP